MARGANSYRCAAISAITALACWCAAFPAWPEVTLSASIDTPTVRLGESFTYTITVSGLMNPPPINTPQMPPSFTVYGPSTSSQFQMGTGRGVSSTVQYAYTIIPRKAGKFVIGPATMAVRGKNYATEPIEIEVMASGDTAPEEQRQRELFVRASVDRDEVYVNQPIVVTVSFYRAPTVQLRGSLSYTPPDSEGFYVQNLAGTTQSQQRVGSTQHFVQRIRHIYVPLRSGELVIGSARVEGARIVKRRRPRSMTDSMFDRNFRSFFDDWPFGGEAQPFSLETEPIPIRVRPLPEEDQPASFTGGVGRYDFEVLTPPREATVGDSVTLTARVAGRGYIQGVGPPQLDDVADCKLYEPESSLNLKTTGDIGGEKIFTYVLVPQREGLLTIPELALSYFDPEREQYVTERHGPFTLQVAAAPEVGSVTTIVDVRDNGTRREIKVLGEDIFSIMSHIDKFKQSRPSSPATTGLVVVTPPLAYAALLLAVRRRERLRTDTRYVRHRAARRNARQRLVAADRASRKNDDALFYQEIHRALTDYLADKLDRPAAGLTVDDVSSMLIDLGINEQLVARVTDLLRVCDYGRFSASGHDKHEQQELLKAAAALLGDLDRALRRIGVSVDSGP